MTDHLPSPLLPEEVKIECLENGVTNLILVALIDIRSTDVLQAVVQASYNSVLNTSSPEFFTG